MKLEKPILVMTINPTEQALKQRRHLPPPNQVHRKKKGKGSYDRKTGKTEIPEMSP